jgi:hypothetical protein
MQQDLFPNERVTKAIDEALYNDTTIQRTQSTKRKEKEKET